jgi:hypothetical protein
MGNRAGEMNSAERGHGLVGDLRKKANGTVAQGCICPRPKPSVPHRGPPSCHCIALHLLHTYPKVGRMEGRRVGYPGRPVGARVDICTYCYLSPEKQLQFRLLGTPVHMEPSAANFDIYPQANPCFRFGS